MKLRRSKDYPPGAADFPIGFWNYAAIERQPPAAVADWAEAGMTLAMGPEFGPGAAAIKRMRAILDAAAGRGIRLILCDSRTRWRTLTSIGEKRFRAGFAQALKEFGKHPSLFGFHVGDEPGTEDFEDACRAMRILKEMSPALSPFLNLLPYYPGVDSRVGFGSWAAYLDAYVEKARPDFLCYDCYSQMNPGTEWENYFRNLREYREAAVRAGIPFWTTLLSVGHFRYRCPTEDDLRWQLSTALAGGAQGILYFFLYQRRPHDNYRVAPISEHNERTETFAWLSRVNRTFLKSQAATFRQLRLERACQVGTSWGGWPTFDGSGLVSRAKSLQDTPLIVSEFKTTAGGRRMAAGGSAQSPKPKVQSRPSDYVMVVNNSQKEPAQAEVTVRGRKPRLYRVGWMNEESEVLRGDGWRAVHGKDFVTVRPWLAPGQMELYRVAMQDA